MQFSDRSEPYVGRSGAQNILIHKKKISEVLLIVYVV